MELSHRIQGSARVYFHPAPFWLLFSSSHLNNPYISHHTLKPKQKTQQPAAVGCDGHGKPQRLCKISAAFWKPTKLLLLSSSTFTENHAWVGFWLFVEASKPRIFTTTNPPPRQRGQNRATGPCADTERPPVPGLGPTRHLVTVLPLLPAASPLLANNSLHI